MNFPWLANEYWRMRVVGHLWQSTVITLTAWPLALRATPARYWVWMAASFKFLLPFSLLIAVGAWMNPLTDAQQKKLLVSTLADRFHVKTHWETKQLPVYNLVVTKGGLRFTQNAVENADDLKRIGDGGLVAGWSGRNHYITCKNMLLDSPIWSLLSHLNRNVIDKTGLTGKYRFVLKYPYQNNAVAPGGNAPEDTNVSLFAALEQQIGLRMLPSKGPVETLVVDHIEMPAEN